MSTPGRTTRRCWHKRVWPAALLGSAALLIAGCGGSATKKDVIARADAICANTLRLVRGVAPPVGTSGAALEAYFTRVAPIVEDEAAQVQKLPRPAQDRQLLDRWVSSVTLAASDYRALLNAVRLRDAQAVATAEGALRASDAATLAADYGLRVCTGSAGTEVAR